MADSRPSSPNPAHAPHEVLPDYYPDETARRGFVGSIFDATASDYDRIEKLAGFGTGPWYRRQALMRAGLAPGMKMLDVAIGTGLVAREAVRVLGPQDRVTGLDPSRGMLASFPGSDRITLVQGRAEALPFPSASFDFVSMGFALRHMSDLEIVFRELRRVLRPGGTALILEITQPSGRIAKSVVRGYFGTAIPLLARVVAKNPETPKLWRYYWDTIEACVPPPQVMATLKTAGFASVDRHVDVGIFSEYRGRA